MANEPSIKLLTKINCSINVCHFYDGWFDVDFYSEYGINHIHIHTLSHSEYTQQERIL